MAPEESLGENSEDKYYAFVGCCYIHKFMNGEAVEGDVTWETLLLC